MHKVIWLTRIRNESEIIQETLDHLATFCTWGIVVYDDCSTDDTVKICEQHEAVLLVVNWENRDSNREKAEHENRNKLLQEAKKFAKDDDWFIYADADERFEFDRKKLDDLPKIVVWVSMKLFDYYITEEDKLLHYSMRKMIGPEYRRILMVFRNSNKLVYNRPDQREVWVWSWLIVQWWYVKHYWKAISLKQREDTCDYYANHFPKYAKKRKERKGKAIHSKSDFWNKLIHREQKNKKWIPLWREDIKISKKNICIKIMYSILNRLRDMYYALSQVMTWL